MFSQTPMITTGTGSGLLPWNTVHATAFMPGFRAFSGKNSTFPALGATVMLGMSGSVAPARNVTAGKKERIVAEQRTALLSMGLHLLREIRIDQSAADSGSLD